MPAPSQLAIATGSLRRLLKEISTYHKELVEQEAAVAALEEKVKNGQATEDGNEEFMLKQQQLAVDQTKAVFEPLKQRIADATLKLEDQIGVEGQDATELEQAKEILAQAKADKNGSA